MVFIYLYNKVEVWVLMTLLHNTWAINSLSALVFMLVTHAKGTRTSLKSFKSFKIAIREYLHTQC